MDRKLHTHTPDKASKLDQFALGFEYNKTLQEVKREIRVRSLDDSVR